MLTLCIAKFVTFTIRLIVDAVTCDHAVRLLKFGMLIMLLN